MNKKAIVILLAITVAAGIGFIYYTYWYNKEEIDIWSLVPNGAVAVYASDNTVSVYNGFSQKPLGENLKKLPLFKALDENLKLLDSLGGKSGNLDEALKGNPLLVSAHVTAKNAFDFLYYFKLKDVKSFELVRNVMQTYKNSKLYTTETRKYQDFDITEVKDRVSGKQFSYIYYRDYFIGSFVPFLVEDVIRHIGEDRLKSFKAENAALFSLRNQHSPEGSLYINTTGFTQLIGTFRKQGKLPAELRHFSDQNALDLSVKAHELLLHGYSLQAGASSSYLHTFQGQKPGPMQMDRFIPNRTALLMHFSFNDGKTWYNALQRFWRQHAPEQIQKQQALVQDYKVDMASLYQVVGPAIGLAVLESVDVSNPDLLLIAETRDINQVMNTFNTLAQTSQAAQDSAYVERYGDLAIRQINIDNLPEKIWGGIFTGFEQTFYTSIDNYLVIGNSVEVIKRLMAEIESEVVWARSVKQHQFVEKTLQEANVTVFWNMGRSWSMFLAGLSPEWQNLARENERTLKSLELGALQFTEAEQKFYTSMLVSYQPQEQQVAEQRFLTVAQTFVEKPMLIQPFVFEKQNSNETILQDSLGQVYMINGDGKVAWKDSLGSKIISDVVLIDYLKNGRNQFFFATADALHVIDKSGNYIEGYPLSMKDGVKLSYASVIDYDNSKNYRFLVADENGHLLMFNKEGSNLEGWRPRKVTGRLTTTPQHVRIRSRDVIVAVQANGVVNLLNRRGEMYSGFPLDVKKPIRSDFFIEAGGSFEKSILTTITQDGELVKIHLDGSIVSREQLYKPSKNTTFRVILSERKNTFIVARQELGRLSLLDRKGAVILEKDYITSDELAVQYYNYGAGKEIFAVTDRVQEFTYLYNKNGGLINGRPLESSFEVYLHFNESANSFQTHTVYDTKYAITSFTVDF